MEQNNNKKTDWAQIINWILTIILIIVIAYATYQRYFEERKCYNFCETELTTAIIENGPQQYINCGVNWDNVFAEDENYLQNIDINQYIEETQ